MLLQCFPQPWLRSVAPRAGVCGVAVPVPQLSINSAPILSPAVRAVPSSGAGVGEELVARCSVWGCWVLRACRCVQKYSALQQQDHSWGCRCGFYSCSFSSWKDTWPCSKLTETAGICLDSSMQEASCSSPPASSRP